MVILNEDLFPLFLAAHPEAETALLRWKALTEAAQWHSLMEVRQTFRTADQVGSCLVFDILGNNYRLITGVNYARQTITLYHFLTHKEYDRDRWKKDCGR
jgi:mRNA interferase HigB